MQSYSEALKTILDRTPPPEVVRVNLRESLGRVLAEEAVADQDLPPFDKSCMDGYALRSCDTVDAPVQLELVGRVAAGHVQLPSLESGQTAQIMTGAVLPAGADAVQMVEKTREVGAGVQVLEPVRSGQNIAPRGSEVRASEVVLRPGRRIGAAEVAVLATFGHSEVTVFAAPSVAVVSTGDELVEVDERPAPGQIRNSNASMLWAQCRQLGLEVRMLPHLPDEQEAIRRAVEAGLECDLLILSGGVSMGEFDYVHTVLKKCGVEVFFHKAAVQPGKPLIVGSSGRRLVFGLPGNPVSAFVTFEIFAKPAILKWMGVSKPSPFFVRAELQSEVRHKPGRLFLKPAKTSSQKSGLKVVPVQTKGSADIVAFSQADSLILVPAQQAVLTKGATVDVILLEHGADRSSKLWANWLAGGG
jgi:molybdopterin molybdotransferase